MYCACLLLFLAADDPTGVLIRRVTQSGRVQEIAVPLSERVSPSAQVSPGSPPVLSFRLFEGQLRRRFNNLDLVLDDAGH